MGYDANHEIGARERGKEQYQEQIERQLDPPGRVDEQHIAFVLVQRDRQARRERKRGEQPQQSLHRAAFSRDTL